MPELPEVETTRRGIQDAIKTAHFTGAVVRNPSLRWPVPPNLDELVQGRPIQTIERRAKYILFDLGTGSLILHLGMSGSLRVLPTDLPAEKHDHVDLLVDGEAGPQVLRYRDPRRFGCLLWQPGAAELHPLIASLGPEPLSDDFDAAYLHDKLAGRQAAIKLAIMDNHVVVGVGNIYANEALFRAGIRPDRAANALTKRDCARLVETIRQTLADAIAAGGSTLRDFLHADGKPGYFQQQYGVYGRAGEPCHQCGALVRQMRQGQRSSFWCPHCQRR